MHEFRGGGGVRERRIILFGGVGVETFFFGNLTMWIQESYFLKRRIRTSYPYITLDKRLSNVCEFLKTFPNKLITSSRSWYWPFQDWKDYNVSAYFWLYSYCPLQGRFMAIQVLTTDCLLFQLFQLHKQNTPPLWFEHGDRWRYFNFLVRRDDHVIDLAEVDWKGRSGLLKSPSHY